MVGWFGKAATVAAGVCLLVTSASAQSKDVQKCETTTGSVLSKFTGAKGKCFSKCIATARKTSGPYAGCLPPYADPTTNACITGSLKGAEAKAGAGIAKACAAAASCPACYTANPPGSTRCTDASGGNPWVQETENNIDAPFGPGTGFPNLIYCMEAANTTPSKDQAKCEDGVQKALVKFVGSKSKCYSKCNSTALKPGGPGRGVCQPPNPLDPAANACVHDPVKGAEAKAAAAIVKACTVAQPPCYAGTPQTVANTFVASVETKIDQTTPKVACGSPSGAFVD
jgi:hypothetical protein